SGGIDARPFGVDPDGVAQDELLVGERRVQLGEVKPDRVRTGLLGGDLRGACLGKVASPESVRLDPVIDPPDPHRPLAHLTSQVPARADYTSPTVPRRRTIVT